MIELGDDAVHIGLHEDLVTWLDGAGEDGRLDDRVIGGRGDLLVELLCLTLRLDDRGGDDTDDGEADDDPEEDLGPLLRTLLLHRDGAGL